MAGLGAAMNTGEVGRGDTVAVFGCGGVGDAAIAGARLAGANPIIAVDLDERKLEWAREFGATHTVNSRETDPVEAIRALTDGYGADVCIEAVGRPEVLEQAFFARDLAGTVVQVGVPDPSMRIELPMIEFFGRGGALKPSWYGDCLPTRDFPMLIDLYLDGRLDLDRFVSETIGLDEVEDAFHKMEPARCCAPSSSSDYDRARIGEASRCSGAATAMSASARAASPLARRSATPCSVTTKSMSHRGVDTTSR